MPTRRRLVHWLWWRRFIGERRERRLFDFDSPSQVSVGQAGVSAPANVTVEGVNGFAGGVLVNIQTLPAGVGTIPQLPFGAVPGTPQTVLFTATDAAALGTANVQLVGTSEAQQRTKLFRTGYQPDRLSPNNSPHEFRQS